MAKRTRRIKVAPPPWSDDFYVARKDCISIYLWVVKKRSSKEEVAGGWTEKRRAIEWLKANYKRLIDEEIENILLVNE